MGLGVGLGVCFGIGPAFAWGVDLGGGGLKCGDLPATVLLYGGDAFGMLSSLKFGGGGDFGAGGWGGSGLGGEYTFIDGGCGLGELGGWAETVHRNCKLHSARLGCPLVTEHC